MWTGAASFHPSSFIFHLIQLSLCSRVFLPAADLPVGSPLCHAVLKTLQRWEQVLQKRLELFGGPPSKYIATYLHDDVAPSGPALLRHKALYEPSNTPFRYDPRKQHRPKNIYAALQV